GKPTAGHKGSAPRRESTDREVGSVEVQAADPGGSGWAGIGEDRRASLEALEAVLLRGWKYKADRFIDTFMNRAEDRTVAGSYYGLMTTGLSPEAPTFIDALMAGLGMVTGPGLVWTRNGRAEGTRGAAAGAPMVRPWNCGSTAGEKRCVS
ncbi:MAG: hypothetical protein ACWGSQ_19565, partial [Longimicrobiales bacterium]